MPRCLERNACTGTSLPVLRLVRPYVRVGLCIPNTCAAQVRRAPTRTTEDCPITMAAIARSAAVNDAKQSLRGTIRSRVRALSAAELFRQSESVVEQLLSHEWFASSRCVCCYIPMAGKELDTYQLLHAILSSGRQCLVPRVFGSRAAEMAMLPVASVAELESLPKNKWGIPEHPVEALREQRGLDGTHATEGVSALEAQIDLLVVPAVAYDRDGHRLGQGRGYYDSFVQRLRAAQAGSERQVKTVGLGLHCQILASGDVPVDDLDETLDLVIGPAMAPLKQEDGSSEPDGRPD